MDSTKTTQLDQDVIQGPAGTLYIDDGGTGGIPVVFLHSFGGSTTNWKNQLAHLRENRRAIAFDFRGHGKSELPSDKSYTTKSLADDISAVVDSLELDRFILVGHSMGGAAAIAYVSEHPDRVAGVILAGTPGKTPAEQSQGIIKSLESDNYQKVMDDYMNQLLVDAKPEVDSAIRKEFGTIQKDASISIIKAMFESDALLLKNYPGPKLIISSTRENKQPNTLHNLFPDVRHKTIDGTSHWTNLDKPEEFNEIMDEFLQRIDNEK